MRGFFGSGEAAVSVDGAGSADGELNLVRFACLEILAVAIVKADVVKLTLSLRATLQQRVDRNNLHVCGFHVESDGLFSLRFRTRSCRGLGVLFADAVHACSGGHVEASVRNDR